MIGRAFLAWLLAWLVSFVVVVLPYALGGLARHGSFRGVEVAFFASWTFMVLLVVFCLLILPLYLWLPDSVRNLPVKRKVMIGLACACPVMVVWPLFLEIPSVLPAALAAGALIGGMVPRRDPPSSEPWAL